MFRMNDQEPKLIYGTAWKKERTADLTAQALTAGFRAIDTANQAKHYTEVKVGEALVEQKAKGVAREALFLQTKFTPRDGQDHRLPYDEEAPVATQVAQSFKSSLEHLHTDYIDSYLLHGPYYYPRLGPEDWEVWGALESLYRSGAVKRIGISNVNAAQLVELVGGAKVKPMVVQNRCYANRGWDKDIRDLCRAHGISYQGFSLLTANPFVLEDRRVEAIAERLQVTTSQVVFAFARQVGMVPLTGTTDLAHMKQDLAAVELTLTPGELTLIENIAL